MSPVCDTGRGDGARGRPDGRGRGPRRRQRGDRRGAGSRGRRERGVDDPGRAPGGDLARDPVPPHRLAGGARGGDPQLRGGSRNPSQRPGSGAGGGARGGRARGAGAADAREGRAPGRLLRDRRPSPVRRTGRPAGGAVRALQPDREPRAAADRGAAGRVRGPGAARVPGAAGRRDEAARAAGGARLQRARPAVGAVRVVRPAHRLPPPAGPAGRMARRGGRPGQLPAAARHVRSATPDRAPPLAPGRGDARRAGRRRAALPRGRRGGADPGVLPGRRAVTAAVRAVVRDGAQAERVPDAASIAVADLTDAAGLTAALDDAAAVYYITPAFAAQEVAFGSNVISAALAVGLPHLVYHSVLHAPTPAMPHHRRKAEVELALRESPLAWTILQPAIYAQTALQFLDLAGGQLNAPF